MDKMRAACRPRHRPAQTRQRLAGPTPGEKFGLVPRPDNTTFPHFFFSSTSPDPDSPHQPSSMAEPIPDLTEDQIEALLSAAEVSLANKTSATTGAGGAVKDKQQQILAVTATPLANPAVTVNEAGKDAAKLPELALRVPQLRNKNKKVCQIHPSPPCPFL